MNLYFPMCISFVLGSITAITLMIAVHDIVLYSRDYRKWGNLLWEDRFPFGTIFISMMAFSLFLWVLFVAK